MVTNIKGTWYKTTVYYCPVCGKERKYTERQSPPKIEPTTTIIESFDYCDV